MRLILGHAKNDIAWPGKPSMTKRKAVWERLPSGELDKAEANFTEIPTRLRAPLIIMPYLGGGTPLGLCVFTLTRAS